MVEQLKYKLPFAINRLATENLQNKSKYKNVIDLGCGTGLAGHGLREISIALTGVDLSKKMIAKAFERELYDSLNVNDICNFLASSNEKYDLFVALDVLIYIGDAADFFAAIKESSSKNAILIFSIELQDLDGYSLLSSGRYAHSHSFIIQNTSKSFKLLKAENVNLRKEKGCWIKGQIITLQAL